MNELKKHKAAIIISAIILIAAIVAVAVIPSALRRAEISNQFEIAQQYLNDLDYESALLAFTRILEIDPKNVEARKALQDTYLAYIRSEWENGNIDHAKELMAEMREKLGLTEDPYTVTVTQEPTCGAEGLEEWDCVLNDDVLKYVIPATEAHAWDNGMITAEATYKTTGTIIYTCSACNTEKNDVIPKIPDEELAINDKNLEAALRAEINKPTGTLMVSDFADVWGLFLTENNITDISPLAKLTNLASLWLDGNNITDISPLAKLTNLTELKLNNNNISDISPLVNLTKLADLDLFGNNISDWSPVDHVESVWGRD